MRRGRALAAVLGLLLGLLALGVGQPAEAKFASLVMDAKTGAVLEEYNADARNYPASLTKMMTLYLTFEALTAGRLKTAQRLGVSPAAAAQRPSRIDLVPGQTVTVEEAILAVAVKSANDAAVVLAENIAGSEPRFAQIMTQKARELGMSATTFRNASGLPNPGQVTTARDMATLARALIRDYPQYYHYFNVREFDFDGVAIPTHNHLLVRYDGADGIKTGYIHASGYNLVTSAVRDGRRLIGVVLGGRTSTMRDHSMMHLLDVAFYQSAPLRLASYSKVQPPAGGNAGIAQRAEPVGAAPAEQAGPSPTLAAAIASADEPDAQAEAQAAAQPEIQVEVLPDPQRDAHPGSQPSAANQLAGVEEATLEGTPEASWWGIQVGAYRHYAQARAAASRVQRRAPTLADAAVSVVRVRAGAHTAFRARLVGLSEHQARLACTYLHRHRGACLLINPANERNLAQVSQ